MKIHPYNPIKYAHWKLAGDVHNRFKSTGCPDGERGQYDNALARIALNIIYGDPNFQEEQIRNFVRGTAYAGRFGLAPAICSVGRGFNEQETEGLFLRGDWVPTDLDNTNYYELMWQIPEGQQIKMFEIINGPALHARFRLLEGSDIETNNDLYFRHPERTRVSLTL